MIGWLFQRVDTKWVLENLNFFNIWYPVCVSEIFLPPTGYCKKIKNQPTLIQTIYLAKSCLFSYLSANIWDLSPTELVTKMKPNINSVEVHPKLSNNGHPVDGALVGAGSLWPSDPTLQYIPTDAWGSSLL